MNASTDTATLVRARPRVAVYGIGFVGSRLTRLLRDKGWEIVGAYNRAGPKVGQDLGRVAGLEEDLGIIVQDYQTADLDNLKADVALIAGPDFLDLAFPIYERFLKAGINIVSYGSHTYDPFIFHPDIAARIDALARENGVTFTGTGLWDMTRIWAGLIAAGTSVRIDSFEYLSTTDPARQGIHWFPVVGIGLTVDEYNARMTGEVDGYSSNESSWNGVYKPLGVIMLQYHGYTVSGVRMWQEPVVFDEPFHCELLGKEIPAGDCVGTRLRIDTQSHQGVPVHTTIELRLFKPGEIEHSTWKVNGLPGMEVRVVREDSGIAQAASGLNRVLDVMAAPPGIQTVIQLGPPRPVINR